MTITARAAVMKTHRYGAGPDSLHTEDYELFTRMLAAGVGFANLDEPLVRVRVDPEGVSLRNEQLQILNFTACARRYFERTLPCRPPDTVHRVLVNRIDAQVTAGDLQEGLRLLDEIERLFVSATPDSEADIRRAADLQRVDILVQASRKGGPALRLAAGRLSLLYARRLLSPTPRHYLASKLSLYSMFRQAGPARA
jgi:hypothetical protein